MLKQIALPLLLVAAALPSLAQTVPAASPPVSGEATTKASYQFCVLEAGQLGLGKMSFRLDYGSKANAPKRTETQAYDEQWKVDGLATLAEALNFMTAKGWDFVSSNAVVVKSGLVQYQYIFRRPGGQ